MVFSEDYGNQIAFKDYISAIGECRKLKTYIKCSFSSNCGTRRVSFFFAWFKLWLTIYCQAKQFVFSRYTSPVLLLFPNTRTKCIWIPFNVIYGKPQFKPSKEKRNTSCTTIWGKRDWTFLVFLCCRIMCLYVPSSVLWSPLRFPH
jgi:hypothetical protein